VSQELRTTEHLATESFYFDSLHPVPISPRHQVCLKPNSCKLQKDYHKAMNQVPSHSGCRSQASLVACSATNRVMNLPSGSASLAQATALLLPVTSSINHPLLIRNPLPTFLLPIHGHKATLPVYRNIKHHAEGSGFQTSSCQNRIH